MIRIIAQLALVASASAFAPASPAFVATRTEKRMGSPLFNSRVDSSDAVKEAMAASEKYGAQSKEARIAWEAVEEMDASDNSATLDKPLDEECSTADDDECQDYEEKMALLSQLLSDQKEKISQVKNLVGDLKSIKMPKPDGASSSDVTGAAFDEAEKLAEAAVEKYGADSNEAKLAWEDVEEIASASNSAAMMPSLDEECLVEALDACEALEELSRALGQDA